MDGRQRQSRRTQSGTARLFWGGQVDQLLRQALEGLPHFSGKPIHLAFRSSLRVSQGKLVRRGGVAVHAAAFLRKRRLVLDSELRENPLELRRILVHELFHFVWLRLSNRIRLEWHCLIQSEFHQRARGELGWSSQWRKAKLQPSDAAARTRKWREYLCESFCDSAASLLVPDHPEMTLAPRFRRRRNQWFAPLMKRQPLPL